MMTNVNFPSFSKIHPFPEFFTDPNTCGY